MPRKSVNPSVPERWEVGGEFHWMGLPRGPFVRWPEPACWHLLGRHSLVALIHALPRASRRLWLPSYFCFDVADYWKSFIEVRQYSDDLRRAEPDWSTICPASDDLVLAVNYFGVRSGESWVSWRERNECLLVEDHSHDPLSGWALRSRAEYAFASVRKTLPVPDGSILWSPRALPLPASGVHASCASALKLAAMLWKREYLQGSVAVDAKPVYRAWQEQGEAAFDATDVCFATGLSQQYLQAGVPMEWRGRRVANARLLLKSLHENGMLRRIFSDWPEDAAPLGVLVEFTSRTQRDTMRLRLKGDGVYCPVHWHATGDCNPVARELAGRLLTIPTDQRYDSRDMDRISAIVNSETYGTDLKSEA